MSDEEAVPLGMTSIRHVGDYQLTAHVTPNDGRFSPELLVSKPGGITMHRHTVSGLTFGDRIEAYAYAKRWMAVCSVTGNGLVLAAIELSSKSG